MIIMDSKRQLTVDIIAKVATGKMDIIHAATLLSKSRRTIERYVKNIEKWAFNLLFTKTMAGRLRIKVLMT